MFELLKIRNQLVGKRIRLILMDDDPKTNPIQPNTMGTIVFVDDMGYYGVNWDNGRSLSVIPDEDKFEIIY
jgi:hypothetical protein